VPDAVRKVLQDADAAKRKVEQAHTFRGGNAETPHA
jgi:hypothetical protein